MNKKLFFILITIGLGFIVFSSYEHGPAYEGGLNRTGSTGGAANCAGSGCHDANAAATIVQISVINAAGTPVTSYTPGATYMVSITGNNTSSTATDKFGFQVSAVKSGGTQAGTFTASSSAHLRVTPLSGLQIVEHKEPLDDTTANHFIAHFSWTAPAAGSGSVTFYGILNAIGGEGQGGDDEGDDDEGSSSGGTFPNVAPNVVLTEGGANPNAVVNVNSPELQVYPNPFKENLHVAVGNAPGQFIIRLFDAKGQLVFAEPISAVQGNVCTLNTSMITPGIYQAVVTNGKEKQVYSLVKQ